MLDCLYPLIFKEPITTEADNILIKREGKIRFDISCESSA